MSFLDHDPISAAGQIVLIVIGSMIVLLYALKLSQNMKYKLSAKLRAWRRENARKKNTERSRNRKPTYRWFPEIESNDESGVRERPQQRQREQTPKLRWFPSPESYQNAGDHTRGSPERTRKTRWFSAPDFGDGDSESFDLEAGRQDILETVMMLERHFGGPSYWESEMGRQSIIARPEACHVKGEALSCHW
ncbi:hypothetical protein QQS21_011987 [Conoideocrella luteorostrata]|uniref:Uncharacterized protein n=1 Tax=Conoideocrella luteorostrata TaxID=1105319 RepID=A0AAJ0FVA7_9HYPO|nr:hypothetical protein QQS21_011987 [Conoideocrella luteorostrata]